MLGFEEVSEPQAAAVAIIMSTPAPATSRGAMRVRYENMRTYPHSRRCPRGERRARDLVDAVR
ncbi:hypothetical protein GCM10010399_84620 [Dactylosporangium fulvum]